jgi:hypothetical protein
VRFSPILFFHICVGTHRASGNVFFVSMLIMGAAGSYLAFRKGQMNNVFGGLLTIYLVATAWRTARRREGETGLFDWGALLAGLAVGVVVVAFGVQVFRNPTSTKDGIPAGMYFFMGSVALLAAAGDPRMLLRGGLFGAQRIARHLWRMCFGLFIASGSLFLGQQQVFPAAIRKANVLPFLAVLPLLLMIFWLFRVRFTKTYKRESLPSAANVRTVTT